MKYYRHFYVRELGFPPNLYEEICAMKPENRKKEDFMVESQPGDEVNARLIESLVDFCSKHSLKQTGNGEIGTYGYDVVRHYESDDLKNAPFLMLETQKRMFRDRLKRDESGRLMLPARQSGVSIKIASGMFNRLYVVSDSARKILVAGQLNGLFFRETVLKGNSIRATDEALWEIDSSIKLPKMVNSFLNPYSVVPCYCIDERPYRYGEPHYQRRDLAPLGEFDIARTFEPLGSEPGMVVSQRFYQHCIKNKIPVQARPVRVAD